jgi:6-phosphogluconate dehydrogenase
VEVKVSVLVYSEKSDKTDKIVQKIIKEQVFGKPVEIFSTIEDFVTRFRRPIDDLILIILSISSRKELMAFLLTRDLLADIPIILILPDRKRDTIEKGHKLYPRFLSYMDSDLSDVFLVLKKMMRNAHAKEERKMKAALRFDAKQTHTVSLPN